MKSSDAPLPAGTKTQPIMVERVADVLMDRIHAPGQDPYTIARAAIAAMRETTEEMIDALYGPYLSYEANKTRLASWQAMIDAALQEPGEEAA